MAEELNISPTLGKAEKYELLLPQVQALVAGEKDLVANLANIAAALKQGFDFFWVGFYFVKNEELVLGPFQGPIACARIAKGSGVCGTAWSKGEMVLVPDVNQFPGHIACNAAAQSEIVLPAFKNGKVALVLDVDSDRLGDFDEIDQKYLREFILMVEGKL